MVLQGQYCSNVILMLNISRSIDPAIFNAGYAHQEEIQSSLDGRFLGGIGTGNMNLIDLGLTLD